jgi:mannitol/fructose-specific phosphotransferase system IIA component (Ntr-type)
MTVLARLRPELIRIAPPWHTFPEAIEGLIETLALGRALPPGCEAAAIRAVAAREAESSTALLDIRAGVPHARLAGLQRAAMALAVSGGGLYEAVAMVPIQIVALVLSPLAAGTDHLNILAEVATLLRSAELRSALLGARNGSEALAAIRHHARPMP